jgi:malate/lactate dehydrogenase
VTTAVIIGAGELGGALAQSLAAACVVAKVTLVDDSGTVAAGKALDINQAGPIDRYCTRVSSAIELDAIVGAAFVVIADHASRGEWRDDAGVGLVSRITSLNRKAPVVCAGAGQALVVERAVRELGIDRSRIFGTAPEGLRSAVIAITALEAGCASPDVSLTVLGRAPGQIIVPWEDAAIAGRRASSVLSPPEIVRIEGRLAKLWPPGPLTLAAAAARAIHAAISRTPRAISAFVSFSPEGAVGRTGMLPVLLGPSGIEKVLAPALSSRDRVRLDTALSR